MDQSAPLSQEDPATSSRFESVANIAAWLGAWLFLSGGPTLKFVAFGKPVLIEFGFWGLGLVPLMVFIASGRREWRDLSFVRRLYRLWPYLGRTSFAAALAAAIGLLHFFAMTARHFSFNSEWDLSIYANACANGLNSSLRNHTSLLADHFEPALYLFTPLCEIANPAVVLLAVQCVAWAGGAWAVRKIALHAGWSQSLATVVMALYLLFSGHQTISYYDFHLYALSLGTIPWMVWAFVERRWVVAACMMLLHLGLKENTSLFMAFLGLFFMFTGKRRLGLPLSVLGLVCFIWVMTIVFPHFRNGAQSEYFLKYYGYLGSSFSDVLKTLLFKPWVAAAEVFRLEKMTYLVKLMLPFAFVHVLRPLYLVPILPALGIALLSNAPFMYSANFHYEAEIYAWLFCSAILIAQDSDVIERWKTWTRTIPRLTTTLPVMMWLGIMIGFFSGQTPQGRLGYYMPSRPQIEMAAALSKMSEQYKEKRVATVERLSAHLAGISNLTMLPEHAAAEIIIVGYPQGPRLWIQDFSTIEDVYVKLWNESYTASNPLPYDRDFRVWSK